MFASGTLLALLSYVVHSGHCAHSGLIQLDPLFDFNFGLNPLLLPADDPATVRQKASVRPLAGNVRSYAGHLLVNASHDSKLFYWFFERQSDPTNAPLVVWLYGEAGRSSLLSVFEENGPYRWANDTIVLRDESWTRRYNMLYVDGSVGAGYSRCANRDGYATTFRRAADDLYAALVEFLRVHDAYQKAAVYLAGEYQAAKFLVPLANVVRERNENAQLKVNVKRLFVGGGYVDPVHQQSRAGYLYQMGVVDPVAKIAVAGEEEAAKKALEQRNYRKAKGHGRKVEKTIKAAGFRPPVDVLEPRYDLGSFAKTVEYLRSKGAREDLHAGEAKFEDKPAKVLKYLKNELYTSCSKELAQALQNYDVTLYTGQYDLVVPTSQIDAVIDNLPSELVTHFKAASRSNWLVDGTLVGYYKCYQRLCQVMIRQANHFIARSQPRRTLAALSTFH